MKKAKGSPVAAAGAQKVVPTSEGLPSSTERARSPSAYELDVWPGPGIYGRFASENEQQLFVDFIFKELMPQQRRVLHSVCHDTKSGATSIHIFDARGAGIGCALELEAFLLRRRGSHGGIVVENVATGDIILTLDGRRWS